VQCINLIDLPSEQQYKQPKAQRKAQTTWIEGMAASDILCCTLTHVFHLAGRSTTK